MNPRGSSFIFFGAIAAFFAHLAAIYLPPLHWIFHTVHTVPIGAWDWPMIGLES